MHTVKASKKAAEQRHRLCQALENPDKFPDLRESLAAQGINSLFELNLVLCECIVKISRWPRECCEQCGHGKVGPCFMLTYEGLYVVYELAESIDEACILSLILHPCDSIDEWQGNSASLELVRVEPDYMHSPRSFDA